MTRGGKVRCACGASYVPHAELDAAAKELAQVVAREHGLELAELIGGRGRAPYLVRARRDFWARLRAAGRSLPEIGRLVGRDHSTVLNSLRAYERTKLTPETPRRLGVPLARTAPAPERRRAS